MNGVAQGIRLRSAAPTLTVSNVGASARWYRENLGFASSMFPQQAPFLYATLRRDRAEIVLIAVEGHRKGHAQRRNAWWDVYIRMRGVWEFYESLRDKKFVRSTLTRQPYGAWEFEVLDPNGYIEPHRKFRRAPGLSQAAAARLCCC